MNSVIKNRTASIREKIISYSIPANSSTSMNLKEIIDADLPSGYSFGGLAGFATNNIQVIANNFGYYDSGYSLQLANRSNMAITNSNFRLFYIAIPN